MLVTLMFAPGQETGAPSRATCRAGARRSGSAVDRSFESRL